MVVAAFGNFEIYRIFGRKYCAVAAELLRLGAGDGFELFRVFFAAVFICMFYSINYIVKISNAANRINLGNFF
jgi:hypothetical protein